MIKARGRRAGKKTCSGNKWDRVNTAGKAVFGAELESTFDPSLFVTIRRRLGQKVFNEMTDSFLDAVAEIEKKSKPKKTTSQKDGPPKSSSTESTDELVEDVSTGDEKRSGMLIVDASVAPDQHSGRRQTAHLLYCSA